MNKVKFTHEILKLVREISLKNAVITVVSSFVMATFFSLFLATQMIPDLKDLKREDINTLRRKVPLNLDTISPDNVDVILKRNIFNIDQKFPEELKKEDQDIIKKSKLPLVLIGVIYSGDPKTGLAVLKDKKRRKVESFVPGEKIKKGAVLSEVHQERIIILRGSIKEYIELEKFVLPSVRKILDKKNKGLVTSYGLKSPADKYKEEGFERQGGQIIMSKDYRHKLLTTDFSKLLQDARAEPNFENGELNGFRFTMIKEGSIYQKSGIQNNDIVKEINGVSLVDTAQTIKLLNSLRSETDIDVKLIRGGNVQTINLQVR